MSVETLDPVTQVPVPYAAANERRLRAAARYKVLFRQVGAEAAAEATCSEFGHDLRAGICERCSARQSGQEAREEREALGIGRRSRRG
jgi:hypothetical protein